MKKNTLIISLFIFALSACSSLIMSKSGNNIDVVEAVELIQKNKGNENLKILDVRTDREFQNGHIENAIHINYFSKTFIEDINKLDKNNIYLIYCKSGGRSAMALKKMEKENFHHLYNFSGGFDAWKKDGQKIIY